MARAFLLVAGVLIAALIAGGVGWRLVSKRRSKPCPSWLIPLLENPYVEAVASARTLIDRAAVGPGMRVLDVGSGPGRLTVPAAEQVGPAGRVVALDIQPQMLRRLKQRVAERGMTNVETVLGGAGEGRVAVDGFDRAFLVTVLGEILDKTKALKEIYTLLSGEGVLSVTEVFPDPHYQSRRTVCKLAESVGFRLHESFGTWLAFTLNFQKEAAL